MMQKYENNYTFTNGRPQKLPPPHKDKKGLLHGEKRPPIWRKTPPPPIKRKKYEKGPHLEKKVHDKKKRVAKRTY